ncbi:hypothetical protein AAC387_Pa02g1533 [Persea americana]
MEPIKEQSSSGPAMARSKLRYPLRSASKVRDEKSASATPEMPTSSSSRRVRAVSNVSKSVSVIELSGKDKSAKPPRRLSIPAKSTTSPLPRPARSITPITEARVKKSANGQGKTDTTVSNVSKSTANRRKFSVLESASYWISQIKLSESASNHLISIGFFKLAMESGCEPLQLLRDKLKLYARQHNLLDFGEPAKELLRSYNILEELEQYEASVTCSQVSESFDKDSQASSTTESGSLKPKSLSSANIQGSSAPEAAKKESVPKKNPAMKTRASYNRRSTNSITESKNNLQKRLPRTSKQEPNKEKGMVKNSEKPTASGKCEKGSVDPSPTSEIHEEGKENMIYVDSLQDAPQVEEISL